MYHSVLLQLALFIYTAPVYGSLIMMIVTMIPE
jgi:hypothetical protein